MKKAALLIALGAVTAFSAHAQLMLSGTSYTQNFDGIGSGLPSGWSVYNSATSSSLGLIESFSSSTNYGVFGDTVSGGGACKSDIFGGGFKNYPSANGGVTVKTATCTAQKTITDRALGVRQVSQTNPSHPNLEPGASFVLKIANTTGLTNLNLAFKLQSLDTTSTRTTTWTVDYATGTAPTAFTAVTTVGTMTTGNAVFSNNAITASFGSALDNKTGPVWIRISALSATTGSGNRASSAIDDFGLTWTGTATAGFEDLSTSATVTSLSVLGNATTDHITFGYNVAEAGNYTLNIFDMTGRNVHTAAIDAKANSEQMTISGLHLTPGMYIAKLTNGNVSAVARVIVQ